MSGRLLAAEYQPKENNVVVCSAVKEQVKRMFTVACTDGLVLPLIAQFSAVAIKNNLNYFKVNVRNRGNKIEILKNGKNLNGKKIANQESIYVSPFTVRQARKRFYKKIISN